MIDLKECIEKRESIDKGNTSIRYTGKVAEVYIHGTHLGDYVYNEGLFHVNVYSLMSYPTELTVAHLRALGVDVDISGDYVKLEGRPIC